MAITGAVTLADIARVEKDDLTRGVIQDLLRQSDLLKVVPFVTKKRLDFQGQRWDTLPSSGFRAANEGYAASAGTTTPFTEAVYFLGGDVKIDRQYDDLDPESVIEDPRVTQTKMKNRSVASTFNFYFINGDHATTLKEFEGIKKRLSNMPSRQRLSIGTAFDPTATDANRKRLIYFLRQMEDLVGGADAWLMNRDLKLGLQRVLMETPGMLTTTRDAYKRSWQTLFGHGDKIVDVGLKSDQATEIIANNYGTGSNETLLFAVRFGDDGLVGVQKGKLAAYDPLNGGEDPAVPVHIIRIDWAVGLWAGSQYCVAQLAGLKDPTQWT